MEIQQLFQNRTTLSDRHLMATIANGATSFNSGVGLLEKPQAGQLPQPAFNPELELPKKSTLPLKSNAIRFNHRMPIGVDTSNWDDSSRTQLNGCGCQLNGSGTVRLSRPEPGSVVIWRHGNSQSGHTGIVEKVNSNGTFVTIEGNTSGGSGVNRGDGVYRKTRDRDGSGSMKVVGFLKIF